MTIHYYVDMQRWFKSCCQRIKSGFNFDGKEIEDTFRCPDLYQHMLDKLKNPTRGIWKVMHIHLYNFTQ